VPLIKVLIELLLEIQTTLGDRRLKTKNKRKIINVDSKLTKSINSLFKYKDFLIDKGVNGQKIAIALASMTSLSMDFGKVRTKNEFEVEKHE